MWRSVALRGIHAAPRGAVAQQRYLNTATRRGNVLSLSGVSNAIRCDVLPSFGRMGGRQQQRWLATRNGSGGGPFALAYGARAHVANGCGLAAAFLGWYSVKVVKCEQFSSDQTTPLLVRKPTQKALKRRATLQAKEKEKEKAKQKWWLLLALMAKDKWYYALAALASILSSLATSAQGRIIGNLFDVIGTSDAEALVEPLQWLLALFIGQSALSFVSSFALAVATTELGRRLRLAYYESTLKMDISKYDEARVGELTHQLSEDIGALQTAVRTAFSRGTEGITSLVSGSVFLYMASPQMAFCMLGILPIMSGAAHVLGILLRSLSDRIRRASNKATGVANETLGAIHTVRVFGAEDRELDRYASHLEQVSSLKRSMALTAGAFYAGLGLGINLITLVICGFGGYLVSTGDLTRGGIASVVTQVQILERSMARLSMVSAQLMKAFRASEHVFDAIQDEPLTNTAKGGKGLTLDPHHVEGHITFEGVTFKYPSRPDVLVFEDFSLEVEPGQVVALVGQSGSGKSSCASLLSRLYDVQGGRVAIDGVNVKDLQPTSLHEVVGVVSQEPVLFGTTIYDNIRYGRPDASFEQVVQAAQAANAHDFISDFPEGYNTQLGERGVLLSGGQRQRIAIARIILRDPAILILDEATSALDNESERVVQQALDGLMAIKKRSTVVIAHRLTTIRNADKIVVFSKGKVVESGTHDELLAKQGEYAKLHAASTQRGEL